VEVSTHQKDCEECVCVSNFVDVIKEVGTLILIMSCVQGVIFKIRESF
jgi:hypothetical protein